MALGALAKTVLIALIAAGASIGCTSLARPFPPPTIDMVQLIQHIRSYRGQSVRTCGERLVHSEDAWDLQRPSGLGYHGAHMRIVACGARPVLDGESCITGRIARRDGSVGEDGPEGEGIMTSEVINYTWYLHERCGPGPGRG
jgi:hypothetical protein